MDHSPFENLFKTLMPIIVFVLWALASSSAQKKKKQQDALKRRRQEELEAERQRAAEPGASSDEGTARPEPAKQEDWKRTIEDVLEEMGLPVERKPEPPPMPTPSPEKKASPPDEPDEEARSLEDLEPEVAPEPEAVSKETVIPKKERPHDPLETVYKQTSSSADESHIAFAPMTSLSGEIGSEPASQSASADHAPEDFQKFIVWSELLGRPVALKEE